jgi:hypothetical protein
MNWLSLVLALLKLANLAMSQIRSVQDHQAGVDEEVARASAEILRKTQFGKQALEEFTANPGAADDFLRQLEPKSDG